MRLPDPTRSQIVLIGVSNYDSESLHDVPAIERNLSGLQDFFTRSDTSIVPVSSCVTILNPPDQRAIGRLLTQAAALAEDLLLIYYAGHGLLGPVSEDLYLTVSGTGVGDELPFSALQFNQLRDACLQSKARTRVIVLDCCYSGRAIPGALSEAGAEEAFLGQVKVEGTYTLTAAPANRVAKAIPGHEYTAFTGELLTVLRNGISGGPQLLTLSSIYRELKIALSSKGMPLPQQFGTDTADMIALGRNPQRTAGANDHFPAPHPTPPLSLRNPDLHLDYKVPPVPRSATERSEILVKKPPCWEYLLYASSLILGLESLESRWLDYQAGRSSASHPMTLVEVYRYSERSVDQVLKITEGIERWLSADLQIRAFGARGEPGNAELIMDMAARLVGVYEDYLEWAMAFRAIIAPQAASRLIEVAALLVDKPMKTIREFAEEFATQINELNDRFEASGNGDVDINIDLMLTVEDWVIEEYVAQMKHVRDVLEAGEGGSRP
ncbi:caspase family protein [Streptomyces sp. NPDC091385]|uniref:caspase, EACC1-associated type n=1 Tax=Streptomyces sp. NPDC091385 TaxID=3365997 RepID=UPI00380B7801